MVQGFTQLYDALVAHPWAATAAIFAAAWAYERFRNARLSKALLDLSSSQIQALAHLEIAMSSFRETVIGALLRK